MDALLASYNWQAALFVPVVTVLTVVIARFVLLKLPAFAQVKSANHEENRTKYKTKRGYSGRIQSSQKVALVTNLFYFLLVVPFIATFESQPIWDIALDLFLILMIYDLLYYLMHRFLFHGKGYFRRVHAVHHQARSPTSLDSLLLHPMEAFLGIALFVVTTGGYALAAGSISVITLVLGNIVYSQINTFNHVRFAPDYFPFKLLHWISAKHAVHHIDMHKGNYATITLFYDKIFGTLD